MKVQKVANYASDLPEKDDHPYRSGAWRPQHTEYDAWDLDVIGEIPDDLTGTYLRNTETAVFQPIKRYHPFEGDAMIHSITFGGGEARYANRFVKTDGFLAEQRAGRSLWAGITEHPSNATAEYGWGARGMLKDAASTDVIVHRGEALASYYQCGELYRLDPVTLEDRGVSKWGCEYSGRRVAAHPKVDPRTGELMFFNYTRDDPKLGYGVIGADGELTNYVEVPFPGPRQPHDMAFTDNWTILNAPSLYWNEEARQAGYFVNSFHEDEPLWFALIPRHGSAEDVRWFEADPTFILHLTNAYEDGDEVVLDGFFEHNPGVWGSRPSNPLYPGFDALALDAMDARAHRWRFNLVTGRTTEAPMSERISEFPMINGEHAGVRHRYSYNALGVPGMFAFNGLLKHDLVTGEEEVLEAPEGVFLSETAMAPRDDSASEDDGYLLTFVSDVPNDRSECWVLDAGCPSDGPIARISLPERISSGTHSTWSPAT